MLRVVDLEALSMQADVPRLLGQFAGVLILISVFQAIGFLFMVGLLGGRPGASSALALYVLQKAL
ncbi:MAG TPA: hypothetical protein VFJ10_02945, partial [Acidobacteriaceae bacterium]|nr:hypothetical protein [Acidobacteriaceae bacterium]